MDVCSFSFKMGYEDANLDRVNAVGQKHPNFSGNCQFDVWR